MLFWRKTYETIWKPPPLSKRTPPFQLNPLFLSNFFMTSLFVQILKTRNPSPLILGGGRKLWDICNKCTNRNCCSHSLCQKFSFKTVSILIQLLDKPSLDRAMYLTCRKGNFLQLLYP